MMSTFGNASAGCGAALRHRSQRGRHQWKRSSIAQHYSVCGAASVSGAVLVALSNRKFKVFSVWICEAMRSMVPSSLNLLRTVGTGSRFCCAMR